MKGYLYDDRIHELSNTAERDCNTNVQACFRAVIGARDMTRWPIACATFACKSQVGHSSNMQGIKLTTGVHADRTILREDDEAMTYEAELPAALPVHMQASPLTKRSATAHRQPREVILHDVGHSSFKVLTGCPKL